MTVVASIGVASVETIRARFPALDRVHRGHPVAYFDGPGGTQVPAPVVDAMADYLYHHNANTHWAYPSSVETDRLIEEARAAVADFLNASADEIAFGLNMTTLTFHLGRALGREWTAGDEVIVTELDHHANLAPWQALARERGIVLRTVPLRTEDGTLDLSSLPALFGPRTRLLALGAAAGCDFLACSAYKFYGPHVGILWGRRERIEALDLPRLIPVPDTAPERLETGTQNHEGIIGAGAAVEFLASLGSGATRRARLASAYAELHRRGRDLFNALWDGLRGERRIRLYGPPPDAPRTPTVSLTIEGTRAEAVARALAERGLFLSHGDFYAPTVLERYGRLEEGFVRAGCACYTTGDEVARLVEELRRLSR